VFLDQVTTSSPTLQGSTGDTVTSINLNANSILNTIILNSTGNSYFSISALTIIKRGRNLSIKK
ncbi:hypothetical protein CN602_29575, partial [Bacillus cereus]